MWEYIDNVIKYIKNSNIQQEKAQVFKYDNSNVISCNSLLFPEMFNEKI
jgi:hypothetical protein